MQLRRNILPKTVSDFAGSSFLFLMIPVGYWFEVFIALPLYYEHSPVLYYFNCVFATIVLFNLVGNYIAIYLIDTSTRGIIMPSTLKPTWRFCVVCESIAPPRSWHCNICDICILKRDHHCNFASCCIGHNNHRHFLAFLFYMTVSTLYCTYFNSYYLWRFTSFSSVFNILKLILPLAVVLTGTDTSIVQLYRVICVITIVGMVAVVTLAAFHVRNIVKGMTMFEGGKNMADYDMGSTMENLKQVLGERWYWTLLSPFAESKLPHDGIHWDELKLSHCKSK